MFARSIHNASPRANALREHIEKLLSKTRFIHRNQARMLVTLLTTIGHVPLEDAKNMARADLLS
jgi:hypothetical protein